MELIVSDTTTLIVLEELERLSLLGSIFEKVLLPTAVAAELEAGSPDIKRKLEQSGCFEIVKLGRSELLDSLNLVLDQGESEAITLAVEKGLLILIDERKGRKQAKRLNLTVVGFGGVLISAVRTGVLSTEEAQVMLDKAIINGYRLSNQLYVRIMDSLKASNS